MILVSVIFLFVVVIGFVFIRRNANTLKKLENDIESRVEMGIDKRVDRIDTMRERIANDKEEIDALTQEIKNIHRNISARQTDAELSSKDAMRIESAEQAVKALRNEMQQSRTNVDRILARQSELNRNINGMKQYVEGVVSRIDNQMRAAERTASTKSSADKVILENRNRLDALQKAGEGRAKQIANNTRRITSEASRIRRNEKSAQSAAANVKHQIGAVRKAIDLNKTNVADVREAAEQNKAGVLKALKDLAEHHKALAANAERIETNKEIIGTNESTLETIRTAVDANEKAALANQQAIEGVESRMQSTFQELQDDVTAMSDTVSSNQGRLENLWATVTKNRKDSTAALETHAKSMNERFESTMKKMESDKRNILEQLDVLKESFESALATMSTNNKTVVTKIYETIEQMTESLNKTTDEGIAEIQTSMASKHEGIVSQINKLTNNILPKTKVDIKDELKRESVEQMKTFKTEINAKVEELRRLVETARENTSDSDNEAAAPGTNIDEEREGAGPPIDDDEDIDDINAPTESRLTIIG